MNHYLNIEDTYDLTCRKLLQHTGGLGKYTIKHQIEGETSIQNAAKRILSEKRIACNNERFVYATGGYVVLGAIIEAISGESYGDFIKENIFIPLKMSHSSVETSVLLGYKRSIIGYRLVHWKGCPAFAPAGYIISTATDINKWLTAQMHPEILNDELKTAISMSHDISMYVPTEKNEVFYGFGWYYDSVYDLFFHEGCNPSFVAYQCFSPDRHLVCLYAANVNDDNLTVQVHENVKCLLNNQSFSPPYLQPYRCLYKCIDVLFVIVLPIVCLLVAISTGMALRKYFFLSIGIILYYVLFPFFFGKLKWKQIILWLPDWKIMLLWLIPVLLLTIFEKLLQTIGI